MKKQDDGQYPERWIRAFLRGGKVVEACEIGGFGRTKYYELRRNADFMAVVRQRKDMAVEAAVNALREHFLRDVEILQEIAESPDTSPQTRVNAVQVALNQLSSWTTTVDLLERVEALEQAKTDDSGILEGVS